MNLADALTLPPLERSSRPLRSTEGIEGGTSAMAREGTEALEWSCKEHLITQEVRDAVGPDSEDQMNVESLTLLLKNDS